VPQFVSRPRGSITLLPRNRYRMYDNGAVGQYRYDAANTRIRWTGGDMAGRGAAATYGLDGTAPEITITFDADDTRRTGNAGPRWQCGLDR
jgi:hypothetical protein